jgi:hypothetical protein
VTNNRSRSSDGTVSIPAGAYDVMQWEIHEGRTLLQSLLLMVSLFAAQHMGRGGADGLEQQIMNSVEEFHSRHLHLLRSILTVPSHAQPVEWVRPVGGVGVAANDATGPNTRSAIG